MMMANLIGYDGSYIGYTISNGDIIDGKGNKTGRASADGKALNSKGDAIGDIIPENIMVDIWGKYKGRMNSLGDVLDMNNKNITAILPGGSTDKDLSLLKRGTFINFEGELTGAVMPDGRVLDTNNEIYGRVLADGSVINQKGKLSGGIIAGDIVINNSDKFTGYVMLDGKVNGTDGMEIGRLLNDEIAIDKENNILGRVFKIGASVLNNKGEYVGRVSPQGTVIGKEGKEIGYIKNNGAYVDLDKKISGYVLQEVAKNRRN